MADARITLSAEDRTKAAFDSAKRGLQSVGQVAQSVAPTLAALGAATTLAGLTALVRGVIDSVDALNDLSDATGASIENISALERIANLNGHSFDTVGASLIKFNQALGATVKPGSDAERVLKAIGLNARELRNMDPAEALRLTAVAMNQFADDGAKARVAQELFGKSLREVAPLLKDVAESGALVATVTTQQAEEAEKFNKHLFAMRTEFSELRRQLVSEFLPVLNTLLTNYRELRQIGGLGTVLKDAAKAMVGLNEMTGADGEDINRALKERTRLERELAFAVSKGLDTRRIRDDIEQKNELLAVLRVRQRTAALREQGDVSDALSRKLQERRQSIGDVADTSKAADEYQKLIERIRERISTGKQELQLGRALNEEEKFAAKVLQDVATAKHGLTAAQQAVISGLLSESAALFDANKKRAEKIKLMQAEAAYISELEEEWSAALVAESKEREKVATAITQQIRDLSDAEEAMEAERRAIGMTARDRAVYLESLRIEQKLKRDLEELDRNLSFSPDQRAMEADRLRDLAERNKLLAVQRADLEQFNSIWQSIDNTAHEVFVNIFEGGSNVFKKLGQTLKAALLDLLYQMTVKKWIISIGASIGFPGAASAVQAMGGGGGFDLLSMGSNLYSMGSGTLGTFMSGLAGGMGYGGSTTVMTASQLGSAFEGYMAANGTLAASGGTVAGAGGIAAALAPFAAILAPIFAAWADGFFSGEDRSYAAATYDPLKGVQIGATNKADDQASDATKALIAGAVSGLNDVFDVLGLNLSVKAAQGQWESSESGRGGVFFGGTLSDGTTFGESGMGSNYDSGRDPLNSKYEWWTGGVMTDANRAELQDYFGKIGGLYGVGDNGAAVQEMLQALSHDGDPAEMFKRFSLDVKQGTLEALQIVAGMRFRSEFRQWQEEGLVTEGSGEDQMRVTGMVDRREIVRIMDETALAMADAAKVLPDKIWQLIRGKDFEKMAEAEVEPILAQINTMVANVKGFRQAVEAMPVEYLRDASFDVAEGLVRMAGGVEQFQAGLSTYVENFYTEEEKKAQLAKNISASLRSVGLNYSPNAVENLTREQFRAIVEGIDITTEAGQKQYAMALSLAGAVASIAPAMDKVTDGLRILKKGTAEYFEAAREWAKQLREIALANLANSVTTAEERLAAARNTLSEAYARESSELREVIATNTAYANSLKQARQALWAGPGSPLASQDLLRVQRASLNGAGERLPELLNAYLGTVSSVAGSRLGVLRETAMGSGLLAKEEAAARARADMAQRQLDGMTALVSSMGQLTQAISFNSALLAVQGAQYDLAVAKYNQMAFGSDQAGAAALWESWLVPQMLAMFGRSREDYDAWAAGGALGNFKQFLGIDGSHAGGLDRVPFDGYIARLHAGERVKTAAAARAEDESAAHLRAMAAATERAEAASNRAAAASEQLESMMRNISPDGISIRVKVVQ